MYPLLQEYSEQMNVPICTGVTALTLDSGEVLILEFRQGSKFGNSMEKSMIKPNQCQNVGIQICDEPTNPHRKMVIETSEELFIPMKVEGSTCGIVMDPPIDKELHEYQNILLSDEFYWDPSNNLFEMSSMEEEYRTTSNFHQYINIVDNRVPYAPTTIK